jgi:large subunit ribosomal protein L21
MYAVIETGGKQYRVEVGTELEVELLDVEPGDAVTLDRVLLVADGDTAAIGRPVVTNASVVAEVVRRDRGPKLISFKYRPKARSRVKKGHRQELTILHIRDIVLDGKSAAGEVAQAEDKKAADRAKLEEAARRQAAADAALAAKLASAAEKPAKAAKAPAAEAAPAKPTRARAAKAAPAESEAPARDAAKAAAPKRPRATKKDA